jgi:hypothetical protein
MPKNHIFDYAEKQREAERIRKELVLPHSEKDPEIRDARRHGQRLEQITQEALSRVRLLEEALRIVALPVDEREQARIDAEVRRIRESEVRPLEAKLESQKKEMAVVLKFYNAEKKAREDENKARVDAAGGIFPMLDYMTGEPWKKEA